MSVDSLNNSNAAQYYAPQYTQRVAYTNRARNNTNFGHAQETDSFEHSSGGGLGRTLMYAGLGAGVGAGLGYYMFGNPISEGENGLKVNEKFYQALDNAMIESQIAESVAEVELNTLKSVGISSKEELEALKKLAAAESLESLPEEVKKALPKDIKTPKEANELVKKAETEIAKIDKANIASQIKNSGLKYKTITDELKNYTSIEEGLKALPDDVKPETLKKYISDNRALFGIKGEEAEVAAEIEEYCAKGKKELLKDVTEAKAELEEIIKNTNSEITKNISKDSKALVQDAPEYLKKAFKDFKWSQAKTYGLWGAGIAAGAYFISSLFGGSKSKS